MSVRPRLGSLAAILACIAMGVVSPRASADPAAVAPGGDDAKRSFARFTQKWLDHIPERMHDASPSPGIQYYSAAPGAKLEVRPTGHAVRPFVGILRYKERLHSCPGQRRSNCAVERVTNVTEIFSLENGRWKY